jgi:hypothetical protein
LSESAGKEFEMDKIGTSDLLAAAHLHEAEEMSPIHESELLDEGLEESFPASDPAAVSITRIIDDTKHH